ncbi:type VI secretion system lipoprotein TssJ [Providencia rettgeri]|nr:type VI secretion system lipoprotein TssJ [Providencia rettgeri]
MIQSFLTKIRPFAFGFITCLFLAGCSINHMISNTTKGMANAIFYPKVRVAHVVFHADTALNSTLDETPHSTVLRIYQLKDIDRFYEAQYNDFMTEKSTALGATQLTQKNILMRPGETIILDIPFEEETAFIGITALFSHPDLASDDWRIVIPKKGLKPDSVNNIEVGKQTLLINPFRDKTL